MDYYGSMPSPLCPRTRSLGLLLALSSTCAVTWSQATPQPNPAVVSHPQLDGELFYELVVSEMSARQGDAITGYALMLEAARRLRSDQLFQRATEMALQGRSGDQALVAARAWKSTLPQSREANRYLLQILVALNRITDTPELLRQELAATQPRARAAAIQAIPQLFGRVSDKALAARITEQALADELVHPAQGPVAWATVGRMRLAAGDRTGAEQAALQALSQDRHQEAAIRFALDLLEEGVGSMQTPVSEHAASAQATPDFRLAYSRVLLGSQRYSEARQQLEIATRDRPDAPEPWLILATLQLQERQWDAAQTSTDRFLALASGGGAATGSARADGPQRLLTQAYLVQAQIAEQRNDLVGAARWLDRIEDAQELTSVQTRRASILARQGRIDEARALLQKLPAATDAERRMRLLAEVQLLRDHKRYQEAYDAQSKLAALAPEDDDVLYELAMLAEKTGKPERMESLLRNIIARDPRNHHAYNALGYSLADRGERLPEARELILKALELAPGDPFITDSLGWVEYRMGNLAEARKWLQQAFEKRSDAEIAAHLGEVLWKSGERDQALSVWRKGLEIGPDNETLRETLKRLGAQL